MDNQYQYDCSVIIPSRNCLSYLKHALLSVQMQMTNELNIETIVVNDGSTDETAAFLENEKANHPHLKIITTNGIGVSNARNLAIRQAQSEHVAFLDADDLWWPNKLIKQITYMKNHHDCVFSFTDYVHFDPKNTLRGTCFEFWKPKYVSASQNYTSIPSPEMNILALNAIGISTVVARRDAILKVGGFDPKLASCEDWDMWLRIAPMGNVASSSSVTMSYLMRPDSMTANYAHRITSFENILARYSNSKDSDIAWAVGKAYARLNIAKAESARIDGNYKNALGFHLKAFLSMKNIRTLRSAASDLRVLFEMRAKTVTLGLDPSVS